MHTIFVATTQASVVIQCLVLAGSLFFFSSLSILGSILMVITFVQKSAVEAFFFYSTSKLLLESIRYF